MVVIDGAIKLTPVEMDKHKRYNKVAPAQEDGFGGSGRLGKYSEVTVSSPRHYRDDDTDSPAVSGSSVNSTSAVPCLTISLSDTNS